MLFLIDENLPHRVGDIFVKRGFEVEYAASLPALRGKPDEALFDYAIKKQAIIVTKDVGFGSLTRYPLERLFGFILIRFPHEVRIEAFCREVGRLIHDFEEQHFQQFMIIEPGVVRLRRLRADT